MSTTCPICNGTKVQRVERRTYGWSPEGDIWNQATICRRCDGTGVHVSRARAGLSDPVLFTDIWTTEELQAVTAVEGENNFFRRLFDTPVYRSEDCIGPFVPPGAKAAAHIDGFTGAVVFRDSSPTGRLQPRLSGGEFVYPKGRMTFDSPLKEMREAAAERGRRIQQAVDKARLAAWIGEPIKPHLDDVVAVVGETRVLQSDLDVWRTMLADHGVTISVSDEGMWTFDIESYSGVVPGFVDIIDCSDYMKRQAERRMESLPPDDKPNPKPKKGAGYHGDWKQGQRRGRR